MCNSRLSWWLNERKSGTRVAREKRPAVALPSEAGRTVDVRQEKWQENEKEQELEERGKGKLVGERFSLSKEWSF